MSNQDKKINLDVRKSRPQTLASAFGGLMEIFGGRAGDADLAKNWENIVDKRHDKHYHRNGNKDSYDTHPVGRKEKESRHAEHQSFLIKLCKKGESIYRSGKVSGKTLYDLLIRMMRCGKVKR